MKKVLITGGSGFIGNEIIPRLKEFDIDIYDLANGDDIFDEKNLVKRLKGCDAVVHMVAIPHYISSLSWEDYEKLNVNGTEKVLEATKKAKVKRFIFFSSGAVYGFDRGFVAVEGTMPLTNIPNENAVNFYAKSKIVAERKVEESDIAEKISLRINWPGGCPGTMKELHLNMQVSWDFLSEIIGKCISKKKVPKYSVFNACNDNDLVEIGNRKKILGV